MNRIRTTADIDQRIKEIWGSPFMESLPEWVNKRGYIYAEPKKADVLIAGINPSFREGEKEDLSDRERHGSAMVHFVTKKYDTYWGPLSKMIDENLRNNFDYLDIFHYREREQKKLKNEILSRGEDGKQFIAAELNLTQHIVEDIIKPSVILVKNKESWAYWGKLAEEGYVWMGYMLEKIREYKCGELYRIMGLLNDERRIAPEIKDTCIKGCFVLFSSHITQYTKKELRPTAELLNNLLNESKSGK